MSDHHYNFTQQKEWMFKKFFNKSNTKFNENPDTTSHQSAYYKECTLSQPSLLSQSVPVNADLHLDFCTLIVKSCIHSNK